MFKKVGDDVEPYEPQRGSEGDDLLVWEAPTYIQNDQVFNQRSVVGCLVLFYHWSKSQFNQFYLFAACRETMGLDQFSVEDIDTVLGVFLVNDFEINSTVWNTLQRCHPGHFHQLMMGMRE